MRFLTFLFSFSSYIDPEVVIGCEDGRACVFDMYSRSCSRIIRYILLVGIQCVLRYTCLSNIGEVNDLSNVSISSYNTFELLLLLLILDGISFLYNYWALTADYHLGLAKTKCS